MNEYKTIQDCAIDLICKEGNRLTNKQIAEKVRKIMRGANTTWKCIAFYKSRIKRGKIELNNTKQCKWLNESHNNEKTVIFKDPEETIIQNEAERYVSEIEKERTGKLPKASPQNSQLGYDIDSGDRHIEVKSSKKPKAWLNLTPNESEKLINDPKYWLYLVEGDFEKNRSKLKFTGFPRMIFWK
jgi:glutamate formiminotransferase